MSKASLKKPTSPDKTMKASDSSVDPVAKVTAEVLAQQKAQTTDSNNTGGPHAFESMKKIAGGN